MNWVRCAHCGEAYNPLNTSHAECHDGSPPKIDESHLGRFPDELEECYRARPYSEGEKLCQGFALLGRAEDIE